MPADQDQIPEWAWEEAAPCVDEIEARTITFREDYQRIIARALADLRRKTLEEALDAIGPAWDRSDAVAAVQALRHKAPLANRAPGEAKETTR